MAAKKIAFLAGKQREAAPARTALIDRYGDCAPEEADVIVAIGGDGFMLETLRAHMDDETPIYGVNCGTVGFLMNPLDVENLSANIDAAEAAVIHPLSMTAQTVDGRTETARAINEISLFRQTRQSARVKIIVNGKVRMESLICDGVLLATPGRVNGL